MSQINWQGYAFLISLFVLLGIGLSIILFQALPYLRNSVHEKKTIIISGFENRVGWITFKIETNDLLAAGNPLNISVTTSAMPDEIKGIQLEFVGASQYFFTDFNFTSPDFYKNQYQDLLKAIQSNILSLTKINPTTFSGELKDVKYGQGGEFDVGITVNIQGGPVGYGMGDTSYALKGLIHVSPPEALIDYKNGNITLGLTWAAIGLVFMALGLSGLIDFFSKLIGL